MPPAKQERIAKRMAALGLCSRRDAERWIAAGRVAVNGATLTTPATLVSTRDVITVDGVTTASTTSTPRLFLYYKPVGLVTSHRDEKNRATVFDALPKELPRVISIGRLDLNSEGLLLLTTSGALSRALELPKNAQQRTYRVRTLGQLQPEQIAQLARGVTIDGVRYQPIRVTPDPSRTTGRNRWMTITLTEGKNREIRRVLAHFDLSVNRLIRTHYGDFALSKLTPGQVQEVPAAQVARTLKTLGVS